MLYPVLFTPIYKEMIWGGHRLRDIYGHQPPFERTGESWDITCRPREMGKVENGPLSGMEFSALIDSDRTGVLGKRVAAAGRFPLLVKIIDANDNLSVQVHPDDAYAALHGGGDSGKNEMWYIMTAPDDGHLLIGLEEGITRETLAAALAAGDKDQIERGISRLPVRAGDMINIPSGLVHALTKGVMVAEVQQNSDLTYRLYDYNRLGADGRPRELHVEAALATADFDGRIEKRAIPGLCVEKGENKLTYAIANRYFAAIKYEIKEPLVEQSDTDAFCVFTCVEGLCRIEAAEAVDIPAGRSVFVPAGLGAYTLSGDGTLLKSFVPDIEKDFVLPLKMHGYTEDEIFKHTAVSRV